MHIKFSNLKMIIGSFAYASHNVLKGYEISRRDDLESFGYMLIFLARGGWKPWENSLKGINNRKESDKIIIKIRLEMTEENLCKGLPNEFIQYMKYVKKLDFEQEPNYQYLNSLFISILSKYEMKKDLKFFWINQKSKKKERALTSNSERNNQRNLVLKQKSKNDIKSNYIKRLYSKIKDSLNKNSSNNIIQSTSYYNRSNNNNWRNNTEKNINFHIQIFNINKTGINTNLIKRINSNNNKKIEKINLTKLEQKNYKQYINLDIKNKNRNTKFNLFNNYISIFQNNKNSTNNQINNKSFNNPIKLDNNSISKNKNVILYRNLNYHNKYLLKRKLGIKRINFGLNNLNKEINDLSLQNSAKNFNLTEKIFYKPIFKKI